MNNTLTKLCFLSIMTLGFAACTEDPADPVDTPTPDMTTMTDDGGNMPVDMGADTGGGDPVDMGADTGGGDPVDMGADTGGGVDPVSEGSCSDAEPPARCAEDAKSFSDWAPASIISKLELAKGEACCYDYTGDDKINNNLGTVLDDLGGMFDFSVDDANATIAEAIADGSIALVLEHEGVMPATGGPFAINFLLGEPNGFMAPNSDGGNEYNINPSSFDEGVWPQARVGNAVLEGANVTGGPGVVAIAFEIFGVTLNLRITAAQVEASVLSADAGKGVALRDGKIGGVIRIDDVVEALNNFANTNCGCLEKSSDEVLITGNVIDGYACTPATSDNCNPDDSIESACKTVADQCNLAAGILPVLADVNSLEIGTDCDTDGVCDAMSVGFTFEAEGAVIVGVSEEAAPE